MDYKVYYYLFDVFYLSKLLFSRSFNLKVIFYVAEKTQNNVTELFQGDSLAKEPAIDFR